jgi:prepilin-type N-terminal cleavage/methylation domain-containing protein
MKKFTKGFTLIELLVVIAIIGILSSVVLASLNSARKKGRDAKRISDISQVKLALELYFDSNRKYPVATTDLVPEYIPVWPTPPLSSDLYGYVASSTETDYILYTTLEDKDHSALLSNASATGYSNVSCDKSNGEYCVRP